MRVFCFKPSRLFPLERATVKVLELSDGTQCLVDDCDYGRVNQYRWRLDSSGRYVSRKKRDNGKDASVYLHREILGVCDSATYVDHVDRNPLNNLRSNLRVCSNSQNQANRTIVFRKHKRQFKGVYWRPKKKAWVAEITCQNIRHYLGYFKDEIEAAVAYNQKAIELFGDFALLNKIQVQV